MKTIEKTLYEVLEIKANGYEKLLDVRENEEDAKKDVARARKAKRIYRAFTRKETVYDDAEETYRAWANNLETARDINWYTGR
jgi:hypothetical protein